TFSGQYLPPGAAPDELATWTQTYKVPGRLDASTLGYLAHAAARGVAESRAKLPNETAREIYTTAVEIAAKPPRRPVTRKRTRREYLTINGKQRKVYRAPNGRFTKKPAAKKPAAKKPAARKPAAKKPAARKPAARKPAARKPVAKKSNDKRQAKK